mgnify:CR=1 FL=1
MPDVDIDFFDRDNTLKLFKHTPASMIKDDKNQKHKTGVYFHAVPEHPVTLLKQFDDPDLGGSGFDVPSGGSSVIFTLWIIYNINLF